ncbi:MAG: Stf0 family sulfotransferase [Fulvivirga sp.]
MFSKLRNKQSSDKKKNPWDELFINSKKTRASPLNEFKKLYGIAFTPRSGSTWLNEAIIKTNKAGNPREWFNTGLSVLSKRIEAYESASIQDYYQTLKEDKATSNNVFGFQITWFQAQQIFEHIGHDNLFDDIQTWFWLKRKDFVAQGVSLFKAIETGKFHSVDKPKNKKELLYDYKKISRWTLHILQQEKLFADYFKKKGVSPIALWYEDITADKQTTLKRIYDELNVNQPNNIVRSQYSKYQPVSDNINHDFIDKFKNEHQEFVSYWTSNRQKKLVSEFMQEYPQYRIN